jgi:hypothetical protein
MEFLQDDRIQWIRQKVVMALDITVESFNDYFIESLERARSAGLAREQFLDFLGDKSGAGATLFFSGNSWTEDIEGKLKLPGEFVCAYFVIC